MEYIYAALLLHKVGQEVSEDNVKKVVAATGVKPDESGVKSLIASLKGVNIEKELENASLISAPTTGSGSASATEKKEEAPKEEKREAAAEGLSALFG